MAGLAEVKRYGAYADQSGGRKKANSVERVRREELESVASFEAEDNDQQGETALRNALNARMASLISLEAVPNVKARGLARADSQASRLEAHGAETLAQNTDRIYTADSTESRTANAAEVAFHFRLFASEDVHAPAPRIVLTPERDRLPGLGLDAADVIPVRRRPLSHYIIPAASGMELEQLCSAAQTAADVREAARQRNWGLEVPWRVSKVIVSSGTMQKVLKVSRTGAREVDIQDGDAAKQRRKRPGKKARIHIRTKEKARLEREAVKQRQKVTKEEHLKEKKKRLNREKKLKRRQKERDKKASTTQGAGEGASPSEGDND